jgi:hypothetical protein
MSDIFMYSCTVCDKDWHISQDRFPCSVCGKFCKSARGLRYHQVLEHNMQYHDAQKTALSSELQIILYTSTGGGTSAAGTTIFANNLDEEVH